MRVNELYRQVAQLGFESGLEDNNRFYYAVNRALFQVAALRPEIKSCTINHRPFRNLLGNTFAPVSRATELVYVSYKPAKAFYFEAHGRGQMIVEKYEDEEWSIINNCTFSSVNSFSPCKGLIEANSNPVRLRFIGDYYYTVRNVALYGYIFSADKNDIPAYEPYTRYDISKMVDDFLVLASPPIVEKDNERLNQGYDVEGYTTVLLPHDVEGCYSVRYAHKPDKIETDIAADDDTNIDLGEELCSLLPLLVASYIWVEDEPEMANYYLNLYRERAADIERREKVLQPVTIRNATGW